MSSTSEHAGLVEFSSEFDGAEDQFIDTVYVRDGLINGLNHCADEWAQVRVNFVAADPDLMGGTTTEGTLTPPGFAEDWTLLAAWPFPVTVLDAGPTPYRYRLHIGAGVIGTPADCDLRVALVPYGTPITRALAEDETDGVWAADTFSNATPGDLSGATLGPAALATAIELAPTIDGPLAAVLCLFVRSTSAGCTPEVWAVHLSEVVTEAP